jgi:hypothetical protein
VAVVEQEESVVSATNLLLKVSLHQRAEIPEAREMAAQEYLPARAESAQMEPAAILVPPVVAAVVVVVEAEVVSALCLAETAEARAVAEAVRTVL